MNLCLMIRHGNHNSASLTDEGREEISKTARRIAPYIQDKSIVVLSSPAPPRQPKRRHPEKATGIGLNSDV